MLQGGAHGSPATPQLEALEGHEENFQVTHVHCYPGPGCKRIEARVET